MSKSLNSAIAAALICLIAAALLGGRAFSQQEKDKPVGRYVAVAPDLVLDSSTGGVKDARGQMIVPAVESGGTVIGKYSAAGFVATLTTAATISGLGRSDVFNNLVKGVSVVDTTSGRLVVNKFIYSNKPLPPGEFK